MSNYYFWAYRHEAWMMLMQTYSNEKLLLCKINNEGINLYSAHGLLKNNIPLQAIKECTIFHGRRSLIAEVCFSIDNQKAITLIPINPFDPALFFHRNDAEAQTMKDAIIGVKNGMEPAINSNPYSRQLKTKDAPNYAFNLQHNWNEETSPWVYYKTNMSKVDWKRRFNATIARIFIVASILATTLAIVCIFLNLSAV